MVRKSLSPAASARTLASELQEPPRGLAIASEILLGVIVASLWLLTRDYRGIIHDARIYVGRAMADLDPGGLGREPLFALDGQTGHSIFSFAIRPLVQALGPSAASLAVVVVGAVLWIAAAWWAATRLMPRRLVPAALVCAAVLPAWYGPFYIFSIGEPFATPRVFAEAAVLAALAALLERRALLSLALLVIGALLHPAMALAGLGVAFLVLGRGDVRWWALAGTAVLGALLSGGAGVGPLKTLFQTFDPRWLALMHERNPFLFEGDWPLSAWSDTTVCAATLLIAAWISTGRPRAVLVSTAVVAACGVAGALLFGELTSSRLMLQLQLWRVLWLAKALAVLSVPACACALWRSGRGDARIALALLAAAWFGIDNFAVAAPSAALALAMTGRGRHAREGRLPRVLVVSAASLALVVAASAMGTAAVALFSLRRAAMVEHTTLAQTVLRSGVYIVPITTLAVAATLRPGRLSPIFRVLVLAGLAAVLAPLALIGWDQRNPTRRMLDAGEGRASLDRLVGSAPRGVYWVGEDTAPWFWLRRPTWTNDLQGTVGAFSRPLTLVWDARSRAVAAAHLASPYDRDPWSRRARPSALPPDFQPPAVLRDGIVALCRTSDGPSAIVTPGDLVSLFAPGQAALWRTPAPDIAPLVWNGRFSVAARDRYTIVRCAPDLARVRIQSVLTASPPT